MKKKINKNRVFFLVICSAGLLFFIFWFVTCVMSFFKFDVSYDDLRYERVTFEKYETVKNYKSGPTYEIYVEEYETPLYISTISQAGLNKHALSQVSAGETIDVYYRTDGSFEICEMKNGNTVFLSLADYKSLNQSNQMIGMIVNPIMIVFCAIGLWFTLKYSDPYEQPTTTDADFLSC